MLHTKEETLTNAVAPVVFANVVGTDLPRSLIDGYEFHYLIAAAVLGLLIAWWTGRGAAPWRRLVLVFVFLVATTVAFARLAMSPWRSFEHSLKDSAILHAHLAGILAVVVFRHWLKPVLLTRAALLFTVAWVSWAGWVVLHLKRTPMYRGDAFLWIEEGLVLPLVLAITIAVVVRISGASSDPSR